MRVIGLMSGTSVDAVDAALVEITSNSGTLAVSLLGFAQTPWPAELSERVRAWTSPHARVALAEVAVASSEVAELFATAADHVAHAAGLDLASADLIASHGQTVHHAVGPDGRVLASLQIGQPAVIAERTGRTVVADFRPRDVAAGGQGAPLVSFVDALLFADPRRTVGALNLGGIANVTIVPAGAPFEALAFDTGPGNALLDEAARRLLGQPFDHEGAAATAARPSPELLDELLAEPYFERRPPKTTGRELFGADLMSRVVERAAHLKLDAGAVLATLTELTARSLAAAIARWAPAWPAVIHVSGGGTRNAELMAAIARALAREAPAGAEGPELRPVDEAGLPSAAKEALAFAVLGHEALHGRRNSLPSSTGARHAAVLGAIWPGDNYRQLVEMAGRSDQDGQRIGRMVLRRPSE